LIPPDALSVERAVLGACLVSPVVIPVAAAELAEADFTSMRHRKLWRLLLDGHAQRSPWDLVTLLDHIQGREEAYGGALYLTALGDDVLCDDFSVQRYARTVRDRAVRRRLTRCGLRLQELAADTTAPVGESIGKAEGYLRDLQVDRADEGWRDNAEVMGDVLDGLRKRQELREQGQPQGLRTGLPTLDRHMGALHENWLIVIAGRPGMGKTSLALGAAAHVAIEQGRRVGFITVEMTSEQLGERLLAARAEVPHHRLRDGRLSDTDWTKLDAAMEVLHDAPIHYEAQADSMAKIRAAALRLKARHPDLALLVIDYLQLLKGTGHEKRDDLVIAEMATGAKRLGKELGVVVFLLSQLNRECEGRTDKRPIKRDLKGSSAIEDAADAILVCYRDCVYHPESREDEAELLLLKYRHGPEGRLKVGWHGESMTWTEPPSNVLRVVR